MRQLPEKKEEKALRGGCVRGRGGETRRWCRFKTIVWGLGLLRGVDLGVKRFRIQGFGF